MIAKPGMYLARQYIDKKKNIWTVTGISGVKGRSVILSAPNMADRDIYISSLHNHYKRINQDEAKAYESEAAAAIAAKNMVKEVERKKKEREYNSNYVAYTRAKKQNDAISRISKDCYTDITSYLRQQFGDILGSIALSALAKTLVEKVVNGLIPDGEKDINKK